MCMLGHLLDYYLDLDVLLGGIEGDTYHYRLSLGCTKDTFSLRPMTYFLEGLSE